MKYSVQDIVVGLVKTVLLLVFLEVLTSALLPAFQLHEFKPAFNVLIVLFLAFKLDTPLLAFLILIIQYVHSGFSNEGWATGTFTGILVSFSVRYVREKLNFSSAISTIIVVQVFQLLWFVFVSVMLCIKLGDFSILLEMIWREIPESIFLSILSPGFFKLLDSFWKVDRRSAGMAF